MKETVDLTLDRAFHVKNIDVIKKVRRQFNGIWGIKKSSFSDFLKSKTPWNLGERIYKLEKESFFMTGSKSDRGERRYMESFSMIDGSCDCCGETEKKAWLISDSICGKCKNRMNERDSNIFDKYSGMV